MLLPQVFLQDIAVATGATFIDKELGMSLQDVTSEQLGFAMQSTTSVSETSIITDEYFEGVVDDHVARLKRELERVDNMYDDEKLKHRIAALSGGVASIKVRSQTLGNVAWV